MAEKKSYLKPVLIAAVVVLFLYSVILALRQKSAPSPLSQTPKDAISIPVQGGAVKVKDFSKNPVEKVGDTTAIEENANFSIIYFSSDKTFLITILSQPALYNRGLAEKDFLNKLKLQVADACKLKVSLTVPGEVDADLAGQDYGLSFCPSGKSF